MAEALSGAPIRALGFDFGTKRIGIAAGQSLLGTAQPVVAVPARDGIPDWDKLDAVLAEWAPDTLVVGLPLNMDDTESELSLLARKFGRRLAARYRLPVHYMDERLSTRAAKTELRELSQRRKGKLPQQDCLSAVLVLESWLGGAD